MFFLLSDVTSDIKPSTDAGHALKINIQTRFLNLSACSWSPYLWNYPYDVHWDALFTFWRRPLQECDTANLDQLMVSHVIMSETCTPYRSNAERRYCPDRCSSLSADNPRIPHLYRTPYACQPRLLSFNFLTVVTLGRRERREYER